MKYLNFTQIKKIKLGSKLLSSILNWFEIPVKDLDLAEAFYSYLLTIKMDRIEMRGLQMALFPVENMILSGALVMGSGYEPSPNGSLLYFNCGEFIDLALDRARHLNAEIIQEKALLSEGLGYYAIILDCDGNRIALYSEN